MAGAGTAGGVRSNCTIKRKTMLATCKKDEKGCTANPDELLSLVYDFLVTIVNLLSQSLNGPQR